MLEDRPNKRGRLTVGPVTTTRQTSILPLTPYPERATPPQKALLSPVEVRPRVGKSTSALLGAVASRHSGRRKRPSERVRVGVVARSHAYWVPLARTVGELGWVWGISDPTEEVRASNARLGVAKSQFRSPDRTTLDVCCRTDPVQVLLCEADCPTPPKTDPIWKVRDLRVVVSLRSGGRKPPAGWGKRIFQMQHEKLSGVTRIRSDIGIYSRAELEPPRPPGLTEIRATLDHVIIPTASTRNAKIVRSPWNDSPADRCGLSARTQVTRKELDRGEFALPSVYIPGGYVIRGLSMDEKLAALDMPALLLKDAPERLKESWTRSFRVPYKARAHALQTILPALEDGPDRMRSRKGRTHVAKAQDTTRKRGTATPTEEQRSCLRAKLIDVLGRLEKDLARERAGEPEVDRNQASAKSDDAEVPVALWNERVAKFVDREPTDPALIAACDLAREAMLRRWFSNVARSYYAWSRKRKAGTLGLSKGLEEIAKSPKTVVKARAAILLAAEATFWDWPGGSGVFFWRWPPEFMETLRDGLPPKWASPPSLTNVPQRLSGDPITDLRVKEKLLKMLLKGHLDWGPVDGLMFFFAVPKGSEDIRMVFDGTKSGVNGALFAPWFALPAVEASLRSVIEGTWMADDDYGEMFYNYWLHDDLRAMCGIDLTKLAPELRDVVGEGKLWVRWARPPMGTKTAPYQACQQGLRAKRLMLGDPSDLNNPFQWDTVTENYPGSPNYDPSLPWVFKSRADGQLAADLQEYVDDLRETGPTREIAWQAGAQVGKTGARLGVQLAPRKKRAPSQAPGPWQGAIIGSLPEPYKTIDPERWNKNKAWVLELLEELRTDEVAEVWLDRRRLQSLRSHLTYIGRVFRPIIPYLKGFHLTIESFRGGRDDEGWKLPINARRADSEGTELPRYSLSPPTKVRAVPRLRQDLEALERLFSGDVPPKVPVRPSKGACVSFCFGDAAGAGFGFSASIRGIPELEYDFGCWSREFAENSSSNLREALNLLLALRSLMESGKVKRGAEVWIFTDNMVTERAFWKGNASSPLLFEVVLRLRQLEMEGHIFLHVVWVAGTRMIAQGTDGLSRGDFSTGIMAGDEMLHHVPIGSSAFERSPVLKDWVLSWVSPFGAEILSTRDWFHSVHQGKNAVWCPPPAAAAAALQELCEVRHTRPWHAHVFVCPALMTVTFRKQLGKVADILFTVPVGTNIWPSHMYEPVFVGIVFPLPNRFPWTLRNTKLMADARETLSGVWTRDCTREGSHLRELCLQARDLHDMSGSVACELLQTVPHGPLPGGARVERDGERRGVGGL